MKPKLLEYILPVVKRAAKEFFPNFSNDERVLTESGGIESILLKETTKMCEIFYKTAPDEFYITSFCGLNEDDYINKNGLLSQWRGYGLDGGYALVFSTLQLEKMLEKESIDFRSVYYLLANIIYSNDETKFMEELNPKIKEIGDCLYKIYGGFPLQAHKRGHQANRIWTFLPRPLKKAWIGVM